MSPSFISRRGWNSNVKLGDEGSWMNIFFNGNYFESDWIVDELWQISSSHFFNLIEQNSTFLKCHSDSWFRPTFFWNMRGRETLPSRILYIKTLKTKSANIFMYFKNVHLRMLWLSKCVKFSVGECTTSTVYHTATDRSGTLYEDTAAGFSENCLK